VGGGEERERETCCGCHTPTHLCAAVCPLAGRQTPPVQMEAAGESDEEERAKARLSWRHTLLLALAVTMHNIPGARRLSFSCVPPLASCIPSLPPALPVAATLDVTSECQDSLPPPLSDSRPLLQRGWQSALASEPLVRSSRPPLRVHGGWVRTPESTRSRPTTAINRCCVSPDSAAAAVVGAVGAVGA